MKPRFLTTYFASSSPESDACRASARLWDFASQVSPRSSNRRVCIIGAGFLLLRPARRPATPYPARRSSAEHADGEGIYRLREGRFVAVKFIAQTLIFCAEAGAL